MSEITAKTETLSILLTPQIDWIISTISFLGVLGGLVIFWYSYGRYLETIKKNFKDKSKQRDN